MVYKMKNIKDNIKEKVLFYYREIKDRQTELENRYYNYVKNKSYSQIKQVDLILIFWCCIAMTCILQFLFVNVWKARDEWTRLENLTIFYVYYRVGYHTSDYMTEYLFNITKKKKEEEKMNIPGATKENPIDLTTPPTTPTTSTTPTTPTTSTTLTTPTTPTTPTKPKIKHITAICQTDDLVEEIEI
jgi:hypothetical protein